jgi:hypothetical protein
MPRRPVGELWLHHTTTTATDDWRRDMRTVQQVAFDRGFSDISYTVLVHPSGVVAIGRPPEVIGAHTAGRNSSSLAVSLIGNYDEQPVSRQMFNGVRYAIDWLTSHGFLVPGIYPTGGHRDLKATACPGRHAYALIPQLRAGTPGPPPPEDDVTGDDWKKLDERFNAQGKHVQQVHDSIAARQARVAALIRADRKADAAEADRLLAEIEQMSDRLVKIDGSPADD